MNIKDLKSEARNSRPRVAATVTWEDCDRPPYELYFETEEEFAKSLSCNPHAFLVGCIVPAMHYGERRIAIDAEICPELRQGLITAMSWLRHWHYEPSRELVRIEAKTQSRPPVRPPRAGFFFSGGIDSFATLRQNRLNFSPEHPGFIKDALLVYGLELDDPEAFQYVKDSLSSASEQARLTLIPVYTNLYLHYRDEDAKNDFQFWTQRFIHAALAAVAHAFSRRVSVVSIAASDYIPTAMPRGSNPLLTPNYSSYDLRLREVGNELSRFERTRLIIDWDLALQHLRVCNKFRLYRPHQLNCGRCEKCVRTMLVLLALGVLDKTPVFSRHDVSTDLVLNAVDSVPHVGRKVEYDVLTGALAKKGRQDLVRTIRYVLVRNQWQHLKRKLAALDGRYLGGNLRRLKRRRPRPATAKPRSRS